MFYQLHLRHRTFGFTPYLSLSVSTSISVSTFISISVSLPISTSIFLSVSLFPFRSQLYNSYNIVRMYRKERGHP